MTHSTGHPCCHLTHTRASSPPYSYATRSEEEKLIRLLRQFQEEERLCLRWFADAEAKGARHPWVDIRLQLPTCPRRRRTRLPECSRRLLWLPCQNWSAFLKLPRRALRCPAGDDVLMRTYHELWQEASEKLELLKADPRKFVREFGARYDIAAS